MKRMKYRKIIAAVAAAWMCVYSLAVPVSAAATGLDVEPDDGVTISTHVEGVVDGWESDDGYFDIIEDKTTSTDHRGRGVLISDVGAGDGEDVSVTFNGGTDVTTMGQEGGIGVHVFAMDKHVSASIEGEPIHIEDISDNGRNASGVMVHTQAGGMIDFTSGADIEAVSRSEGKGLEDGKMNHIYGIYLRSESNVLWENYYIDDSGRRVPVVIDDLQGTPSGLILNDPSGFYTGELTEDLYGVANLKSERQGDEVISTYVFYICKDDGTLVAISDAISKDLHRRYNPNVVGSDPVEGEEIEITVHSSEDDPGRVVTIKQDPSREINIAEDVYHNFFVYDGLGTIYSIMDENNTAYELHQFEPGSPWIKADISGNISADGLMEADGLAAMNLSGGMDIELQSGTSLSAEGSLAAGISVTGSKPYTIKGEDGGINIRAVGKTGERSDAIGLFSNHGSMGENSEISITGEGNSIYVETDLQTDNTSPSTDLSTRRISAGILTNAMSAVRRGASDVRYEGSVEAVGKNVHGLYATAQQMGVNRTRVIGDITVKNTLNDGIYVDEYIPAGLSPMAAMFFDPKSDIYVRGNLTMEDAGSESSGIAAFGGTVIVDGNVEVNGAQGTSGGPIGIYAEGKDTIVLVTGELNSRAAVLIPSDDDNNANVYVWKYQDSSRGKTEQIGFVLKIDDQEELSGVTLESSSEHFIALERDGYTYYGARAGDTITIKGAPSEADIAVLDANEGEVEVTDEGDGTYTFTVPDKLGALVTLQKPAPTPTPEPEGFSDVQDPKNPYYKAIYWAADAGITKGYPDGTFGINRDCTRGECMMFLWRYANKPAPKNASKSPFKDVPKTHTFYKAILWGSQKGITKGYSDGTFGINRSVTRGECMMFLWRLRGKPAPKAVAKAPFPDVPKSHVFYKAVLWGYQKKVTTGFTSGKLKGKFGVNEKCSRGQIVTFLYRAR